MRDTEALLAAFDAQGRAGPFEPPPGIRYERDGPVLRVVGADHHHPLRLDPARAIIPPRGSVAVIIGVRLSWLWQRRHSFVPVATTTTLIEIFGTDKLAEYAEEAEQRWGDTEAWKQSQRRTAAYTKEDWIAIKAEADASIAGFAEAIRAGETANGTVAMDLAEAHRQHISRWFYDAAYIVLAQALDAPLVTADLKMREAERIGVAVHVHRRPGT